MRSELDFVIWQRMERTAQALRKNRMLATCLESVEDVVPFIKTLLTPGTTIASGRSATLEECGVTDLIRNAEYCFLDRHAAKTPEEQKRVKAEIACADWFMASANAITEAGEIYELDGHASRIGPIAFGPDKVLLVAGYNKIVPDLAAAKLRVEQIAAPANAKRQGSSTPCTITGTCQHCKSPGRICCSTLILSQQRVENRIHVILVKDILGY